MELKEQTKRSSRTLAKHLNQMVNMQFIEKRIDIESGNYPHPVYYKAKPNLITGVKASMARQETIDLFEPALNEVKDPLMILDGIHAASQLDFIDIILRIQQYKNMTNEEIYFFEEIFLWANYRQYTSKLIQASRKIIDDINITQSLMEQAKRNIEVYQKTLKKYEEIQQQKKPWRSEKPR